jgi:hypothetical protein
MSICSDAKKSIKSETICEKGCFWDHLTKRFFDNKFESFDKNRIKFIGND